MKKMNQVSVDTKSARVYFLDLEWDQEYELEVVLDPEAAIDPIEYRAIANFLPSKKFRRHSEPWFERKLKEAVEVARRLGVSLVIERRLLKVGDERTDPKEFTFQALHRARGRGANS